MREEMEGILVQPHGQGHGRASTSTSSATRSSPRTTRSSTASSTASSPRARALCPPPEARSGTARRPPEESPTGPRAGVALSAKRGSDGVLRCLPDGGSGYRRGTGSGPWMLDIRHPYDSASLSTEGTEPVARVGDGGDLLKCSFCGKSQKQVKKLIAGPGVYICDECIDLCNEIIEEELSESSDVGFDELPKPTRDLRVPRQLRHRAGPGQEGPLGRGLQPLQAGAGRRHATASATTPSSSPSRTSCCSGPPDRGKTLLAQTLARMLNVPVRHRRRHRADRGRLRRRGRREHPAQADPGGRLRRQEGRDRDHLHRRDRQDRPQEREPVDHPRRLRRGRAAGAAEDPRGHHRVRAAAGRPQAPAPGVHPDRHDQRAVHRRRRLRRARHDHRAAHRQEGRSASAPRCTAKATTTPATCSARSCPRTCSSSA